jgi:hypothetical protein
MGRAGARVGEGEAGVGDEGIRGEGIGVKGGVAAFGSISGIEAEFNAGCGAQEVSRIRTSRVRLMSRRCVIGQ